jgi:hypothetical protein
MMKTIKLILCLFILVLVNCKKKSAAESLPEIITTEEKTYSTYSNLKVGNYWIYKYYQVEADGESSPLPGQDSTYVEKDTLIGGNKYAKYVYFDQIRSKKVAEFFRDSLHYIVSPKGICFSSEDTSRVFFDTLYLTSQFPPSDTIARVELRMKDMNKTTEVPAGTFQTCNARMDFYMFPKYSIQESPNPRSKHKKYAKNVGVVVETLDFYLSMSHTVERRLVRYHVN